MKKLTRVGSSEHALGAEMAPVTLVEYGDYQCPYCGDAYAVVKAIQYSMPAVRFVFRNFPLSELHPDALGAAYAAEAAALQDKFWPMHDALYEHQDQLGPAALVQYASTLGLDVPRFQRDAAGPAVASRVEADIESGLQAGVRGTPAFFVNGQFFRGDWRGEELRGALRSAWSQTHARTT